MGAGAARLIGVLLVLVAAAAVVLVVAMLLPRTDAGGQTGSHATGAEPVGDPALVLRVVDGDTIVVRLDGAEERVRYIGVDAPELADPEDGIAAECGALDARDANTALVGGRRVILEPDASDRDRFGRLLRHVWVLHDGGWMLAAEQLVAEGWAEARSYPPDTGRDSALDASERSSRSAGRGIWGGC
jgi:micrococcal nuclease